jgi:hypothetical protein
MFHELLTALWQGLLILLGLLVLFGGIYAAVYWFSWGRHPHWVEGFRDQFKLENAIDNRFWPWIHQDTEYWIVRVRLDRGAIIVKGTEPAARYWSLSYYPSKTNILSIDTQSVSLDDQGQYRITIGREVEDSVSQQTIKTDPDVTRAVIQLRVTLRDIDKPLALPSVLQGDGLLVKELVV